MSGAAAEGADGKKSVGSKEGVTAGGEGGARGGVLKLKDPNQAHETLDIAKNVP